MSARLGLVVNPRSHAVARRGSMLEAAGLDLPGAHFLRLDSFDRLNPCITQMAAAEVDTIFVEGGDGTLLAVLSACLAPGSGFATLPDIAVLPGGSTNLAAQLFGFRGRTPGEITRRITALAHEVEAPQREHHRALRIESSDLERPAIGFVLSTGSLARAMLYTQREFHGSGRRGGHAVALAIARFLIAPGRYRDTDGLPVMRPSPLTLRGEGIDMSGDHALTLISSLPRLSLGLAPFWGSGEGGVAVTHATWPILGFRRALARIVLGLTGSGMASHGLTSHRSDWLELDHSGPVVVDGEAVLSTGAANLRITTTPPLAFLR
jgi:hypothetical protein